MSKNRKGIILAGGTGTRLYPLTSSVSKQLMPVYDKPMIHYSLSTLMLSGIRDILIITTERDLSNFKKLIGDGDQYGISIQYAIQSKPDGLAQAFLIGEDFIENSNVALILGDNLFHGTDLTTQLDKASKRKEGGTIFAYPVDDPERYGVVEFDEEGKAISLIEKPKDPRSKYAITGIYFYDNSVIEKAKKLRPSSRGELEITDINLAYLKEGKLNVEIFGRGMAWLDTGTFDTLQEAGIYVAALQKRQGLKIGCPEEIAWRLGWINDIQLKKIAKPLIKSGFGKYLMNLLNTK